MGEASSNSLNQPVGVLLAAGRGRRLGGRKQFYPWPTADGDKPLVAAAFDAVAPVCGAMYVVLGHRQAEVIDVLGERNFFSVEGDPDAPMFTSIQVGIVAALRNYPQAPILLHPGDHPEVSPTTLEQLLAHGKQHPTRAIIPEFQSRGGHPVLIPVKLAKQLLTTECPQGLGHFWSEQPELCFRFAVTDQGTIRDIDRVEG